MTCVLNVIGPLLQQCMQLMDSVNLSVIVWASVAVLLLAAECVVNVRIMSVGPTKYCFFVLAQEIVENTAHCLISICHNYSCTISL